MYRVSQKLKNVKQELKKWNKDIFRNVQKRKDQIKEELEMLEQEMIKEGRHKEKDEKEKGLLEEYYKILAQ